jgi:phosphatidylinositol glycan class C protein
MRRYVRQASLAAHVGLTVCMAAAAAALLAPLSAPLAAVFVFKVLFVSLLCPWWMVRTHKFKAKINGPWDEAVPHVPRSVM